MIDETLLTLRQLSSELNLPESTIRYYRDAFIEHIPSVGTGRRRRYPPEAVAVLRSIADGYSAGRSRAEIIGSLDGSSGSTRVVSVETGKATRPAATVDEVSNLDLLAAIVDGEREQRDALWQMAGEIVRLTQVLEGQDKVLTEIADKAGIVVGTERRLAGTAPMPALSAPIAPAEAAPVYVPFSAEQRTPEPGPATRRSRETVPRSLIEPAAASAEASSAPGSGMDKLRAELESERALVEKLREAKLALEHRAADAEAALEERKPQRDSLMKRLLGGAGA